MPDRWSADFFSVVFRLSFLTLFPACLLGRFLDSFFQLFKLKSKFDLFLEASWDPLGTILGDFWTKFGNFLATFLASRFGIDF